MLSISASLPFHAKPHQTGSQSGLKRVPCAAQLKILHLLALFRIRQREDAPLRPSRNKASRPNKAVDTHQPKAPTMVSSAHDSQYCFATCLTHALELCCSNYQCLNLQPCFLLLITTQSSRQSSRYMSRMTASVQLAGSGTYTHSNNFFAHHLSTANSGLKPGGVPSEREGERENSAENGGKPYVKGVGHYLVHRHSTGHA